MEAAGKELAGALADPARGAEELAKKYGLVSFAEREQIKQLAAVGDRSSATAKLLEILAARINQMEDPTSRLMKIWEKAKAGFSNGIDKFGQILDKAIEGPEEIAKRQEKQARRALDGALRAQGDADAARAQDLGRLREDGGFAVREIQARTFAEREALAIQKAYVETFRQTNDKVKAGIAAETERAKMLAESTRKVDDLARTAREGVSLARADNPFARRMMEIDIAERNFRRENLPNAFSAAATAATTLANALNAVTGGIGRLIPMSEWAGSSGAAGGDLARAREAIAAIESRGSGGYGAIGPRTRRGDRAYGRYQVMGQNIPAWTMDALGRSLSPQQFLGDPGAQDAVFNRQFWHSLARYGNMNDAASVWFTGRPLSQGAGAREVLGTSGSEYVRRFNAAMGGDANDNLSARTGAAFDDQRAAAQYELRIKPQEEFRQQIEASEKALQSRIATLGQDQRAIDETTKRQDLMNDAIRQTGDILPEQQARIDQNAKAWAEYQQHLRGADDAQRRMVENLDMVRSSARDALGGMASDLMDGKRAGDALADSLSRIADRLVGLAADRAIEGIFGKAGSAQGGGFLGGLLGGIGKIFGFADGGVMTSAGPLPLRRYANGGVARTPQIALYAEAGRAEAYVPLPDGRSIPVTMRGPANGGAPAVAPVTVNLIGAPPGAQVKESRDARGGRRVDVIFADQVASALASPQAQDVNRGVYGVRQMVARR